MSAFMCDEGVIDDVVTLLCLRGIAQQQDANDWGKRLMLLNAESMRQRYPSIETDDRGKELYGYLRAADEYQWQQPDPAEVNNLGQLFMSLRCFTYQSCEGNCDKTPLYRKLAELEQALIDEDTKTDGAWDRKRA